MPTKDVDFEAEMKSAFKVFDMDNSGTISLEELRKVMKSFGEILTEDELDSMIKEVDKNGDGTIDCLLPLPPLLATLLTYIFPLQTRNLSISWSIHKGLKAHAIRMLYFGLPRLSTSHSLILQPERHFNFLISHFKLVTQFFLRDMLRQNWLGSKYHLLRRIKVIPIL